MTHSILKQFFFSRCYKSCYSDIFTCIFSLFLFAITFFQHFKCILFFTIWSCNIKNANGWSHKWCGFQAIAIINPNGSLLFFGVVDAYHDDWSGYLYFLKCRWKEARKIFFIHIWHVKSMRHINNKNRDRGGNCGIFFSFLLRSPFYVYFIILIEKLNNYSS